jgi:hypothetical protein
LLTAHCSLLIAHCSLTDELFTHFTAHILHNSTEFN